MPKKKSKRLTNHPKMTSVNNKVEDAIAAALSIAPPPVLMKVCRLCETKDGPFLNIFDADKVTARKIEDLMPFGIAENDDLPHKICFRCSAKVEELYEFIHRCIKTQENLRSAMGKHGPLTMKSRSRVLWEQELNKTKLSNDDICDVLIKRAMEGIPLNAPVEVIAEEKQPLDTKQLKVQPPLVVKKESTSESEDDDDDNDVDGNNDDDDDEEEDDDDDKDEEDVCLKQVKLSFEKNDVKTSYVTRTSKLTLKDKPEGLLEGLKPLTRNKKAKTYGRKVIKTSETDKAKPPEPLKPKLVPAEVVESKKETVVEKVKEVPPELKDTTPPFNIMDHVCTIKVNKVGTLFQCKLCNRNFLRKEIVLNHGCAKNNAPPKETNSVNAPTPGPPKPPTVKYIKMNKDFNNPPQSVLKPMSSLIDKSVESQPPKAVEPEVKAKPHPKAGPASRVKAKQEPPKEIPKEMPKEPPPKPTRPDVPSAPSSVSFPAAPSLNTRYKLVPGPNNTFQLVEDSSKPDDEKLDEEVPVAKKSVEEKTQSKSKKRKANDSSSSKTLSKPKNQKESPIEKSSSPEVIDLDDNESQKTEPYPVGLFQPVPHHSSVYPPSHPPVPFTTPAMKKQSYTIVQTGNPSKLLISTKAQPVEEPAKKKSKKKTEGKKAPEAKEPFTVTLEDAAPAKDPGFFTFVSLDPLLQPSYVLPGTDNIIQESQITTSTAAKPTVEKEKEKYPCNMCGETFSREKKLLAHIQSHYNQMDEEDEMRAGKPGPRRRTRKT